MKVTLTRQAVNHVNKMCNSVPDGVFIDKLKDGRRSLKVWAGQLRNMLTLLTFCLLVGARCM